MFPIDLSVTHIEKHTCAIWSFFVVPCVGARPEFKAGQAPVMRMDDCFDELLNFSSTKTHEGARKNMEALRASSCVFVDGFRGDFNYADQKSRGTGRGSDGRSDSRASGQRGHSMFVARRCAERIKARRTEGGVDARIFHRP